MMTSALSEEDRSKLEELLFLIPQEDLFSLAKTITLKSVNPSNKNDAICTILLHEASLRSALNRKKVTRDVIFRYLHSKNVPFQGTLDKCGLIEEVMQFWEHDCDLVPTTEVDSSSIPYEATVPTENTFALKFAEWYYNRLNEDFRPSGGGPLCEADFMKDCKTSVRVILGGEEEMKTSTNAKDSVYLIRLTRHQFNLYFLPHLTPEGTRASVEPHGLMMVCCCGTLHVGEGESVGIFEQTFGLLKDPLSENNWKIQMTEVTLRLKNNTQTFLPQLAIDQS